MRILALETSAFGGSVASLVDGNHLTQRLLPGCQRTAQSLSPAMLAVLNESGWQPTDVELVAVTKGPGSFTGLRIGVTAAKTFAYAVRAALLGVSTLETLAQQIPISDRRLWTILNAERGQLFAASFHANHDQWSQTTPSQIFDFSHWQTLVREGDQVTGPALDKLASQLPAGIVVVDQSLWSPTAIGVGQVAWRRYERGDRDDVYGLLPDYGRESAAVEKADASTTDPKK